MSFFQLKTDKKRIGLIKLNSRTLLFLLLIVNIAVFLMPSVIGEIMLMAMIITLALLCGVFGFSLKLGAIYFLLLGLDYLITICLGDTYLIYIALTFRFMRKVFPAAMISAILIMTTSVGEFMACLTKMKVPKSIMIPLTVLLRYFPAVAEDRQAIKKAMALRGLNGCFTKHPIRSVECLYVPLMMSASRRADELSSAAVTRGIENPKPRTSIEDVRFHFVDLFCTLFATCFVMFCVWGI
ncbi:energy-coupling factor transporter transmembrane protein EcfT [Clostridium sp. 'deep sea']|uniref:energy-coupling factor transporter transmembrane component T family protein n=1 Tax=Clostridium sp. 'deep sea' TaxID=2779445 RepID=UPI0018966186|nr:energy-coupling factor transporter transmembrane component T [Clostridium sp. 'deep sea']QOR35877.1 energy-coupling factor transporter transmembrane protein EcfT [Clostridium sp. 'deep sea']